MSRKSQNNMKIFWGLIIAGVMIAGMLCSFAICVHQSQAKVIQYFSLWEEDLGHGLLIEKNSDLLVKMSHQLQDLDASVDHSFAQTSSGSFGETSLACPFKTLIPISLSTLPVGNVSVCFNSQRLLLAAAASPAFLLLMILTTFFSALAFQREWKKENALKTAKEIADLSRQVAHDIRGPLMALKTLSRHARELPEEKNSLLTGAIDRIHGIAEDLLKKSRNVPQPEAHVKTSRLVSYAYLQEATEEIIPELKARLAPVNLQFVSYEKSPLMIGLSKKDLQRIISNLVQNSLEAMKEQAEPLISVQIHRKGNNALLEIMDNGSGISEELIPQVLAGKSHGKENGNGLGLSGSKQQIENIGGQLELRSKIGMGTQVRLQIPLAATQEEDSLLNHKT